jgi:tRNA modification GTPase
MAKPETIFALASGKGRAGIAVIRISGPAAAHTLGQLSAEKLPKPRCARLISLSAPGSGELLDKAIVLWFPGPDSFTGEDVVELHAHGGPAVLKELYGALGALPGVRPAEAGEFSRRAFENGKLDLTMAEGLNDLIWAETVAQKRLAQRQLEGALSEKYEDWRGRLLRLLAHAEAAIDFSDEDLPEGFEKAITPELVALKEEINRHLEDRRIGERIRSGFRIVILGAPNVGKSSLLNALAKEEAAIVSAEAGTTRDVIELRIDLGGYAASLADTAGLRESENFIEQEGVRRALDRAREADLKLLLVDAQAWPEIPDDIQTEIGDNSWLLVNKCDLGEVDLGKSPLGGLRTFGVSAKTGDGLHQVLSALEAEVVERLGGLEAMPLTRLRHRQALEETTKALERVLMADHGDPGLIAEDIRLAARALGRVTGRIDVEDVLNVVFADFCIGK